MGKIAIIYQQLWLKNMFTRNSLLNFMKNPNHFLNSGASSHAGKHALKLNIKIDDDGKGFEGRRFTF